MVMCFETDDPPGKNPNVKLVPVENLKISTNGKKVKIGDRRENFQNK